MTTTLLYILFSLFLIIGVFLILLILIQKGRGGGLASAFGGGGGNTAFGSKTGDVLTWATSIVFGIFILLAICFNIVADRYNAAKFPAAAAASNAAAQNKEGPAGTTGQETIPVGAHDPALPAKPPAATQ